MKGLLTHPWFTRAAIGVYVATIFTLVAAYFAVSTADIDIALYLQAPSTLVAGEPTASRGIVMNAPTGNLFVDAVTTFEVQGQQVGKATTEPNGHLHAKLEPAAGTTGRVPLRIKIEHAAFDPILIEKEVEVAEATTWTWPAATSRMAEGPSEPNDDWTGDLRVRMLPSNREIPRGLPSTSYLLLTDAEGRPVRGTIAIDKIEGMLEGDAPVAFQTDQLGLAPLELVPMTTMKWSITATQAGAEGSEPVRTGTGSLRIETVPSQFSMRPTQLLAAPGQPVEAVVHSLHRSGGILVDLYHDGRWVDAAAFGMAPDQSGVRAIVPDGVEQGGVVRMQVYKDIFTSENAWDSRWLAVAPDQRPDRCTDAARNTFRLVADRDEKVGPWAKAVLEGGQLDDPRRAAGRCSRWLEAALLAVPQHFEPSPILVNSQKDDREELDVWRKRWQSQLLVATTSVLVIGFLFVLLLVLQGTARAQRQRALIEEVHLETATDDDLEEPQSFDAERWLVVIRSIIMVLAIFTFGASLLMLLSWM